jgi:lipoprotein NlpD
VKRVLLAAGVALLLAGCASRKPAPVVERAVVEPPPTVAEAPRPPEAPPVEKPLPTHAVKRGETLVGIALQYGLDYRELAAWNNIVNPNAIKVGQVLVVARPSTAPLEAAAPVGTTPLASSSPIIEARPLSNTPNAKVEPRGEKVPFSERALGQMSSPPAGGEASVATPAPSVAAPPPAAVPVAPPAAATPRPAAPAAEEGGGTDAETLDWIWPVKGKVIAPFTESTKGVDIGGKKGTPVVAAASGRVVYAGAGLRGYGKLVIIKHNNLWLSAYAHNENIVVKESQDVRRGQKIAEMGATDADQVKLHFEVRRQGKPVDPAKVLPPM